MIYIMNELNVKNLLEKYFEGATSTGEERELKAYFASGQVADSLTAYIPLFAFFAEEKRVTPPVRKTKTIRRLRWLAAVGIAASIALFVVTRSGQPEYVYIMDGVQLYDRQAALATADSKLQLLAASMQKAKAGMSAFDKMQNASQSLEQWEKIPNAFRQVENNLPIFRK
ncbi:hypothetical protein FACS189430_01740 [Bacteroidia bacterium]|nr:hypothetical protein FACS189430_01740 [Bacteroidia bacterium]